MQFVLLTGADIGEKELTLQKAASIINERIGRVIRTSRFFESAPWGFESETTFLNQALLIETELQPEALIKELQAIEKELGLPVKLVGLGEGDRDLVDFDPDLFVEALFGDE